MSELKTEKQRHWAKIIEEAESSKMSLTDYARANNIGRLPMTNIQAEHVAKSIALARKNFLFADTPARAKASVMTYSLLETAKANGHHPFEYLTVLLNEIANSDTIEQFEQLPPWNLTIEQVREIFKTYPAP